MSVLRQRSRSKKRRRDLLWMLCTTEGVRSRRRVKRIKAKEFTFLREAAGNAATSLSEGRYSCSPRKPRATFPNNCRKKKQGGARRISSLSRPPTVFRYLPNPKQRAARGKKEGRAKGGVRYVGGGVNLRRVGHERKGGWD